MTARYVGPAEFCSAEWDRARPHLLAAAEVAKGTHDEVDLIRGVLNGSFHLWMGEQSAILSEVVRYPRLLSHRLFLAGGDLHELLAMEPELAAVAASRGCTRHELIGRKGWKRALTDLGYGNEAVALHRSIG